MPSTDRLELIAQFLVVVGAGLLAGIVCTRLRVSLLVGYLLVGSIVGTGGFDLVSHESHDLEALSQIGALFLLFAIGLEFSLEELAKLARHLIVGGTVQMAAVAVPLTFVAHFVGLSWPGAILAGAAGALSSTVLVFRTLSELGETDAKHGRTAIAILLFQDAALVPLLLLVPLLTNVGEKPSASAYLLLTFESLLFVGGVLAVRKVTARVIVPLLARLRSLELVVLFSVSVLGCACWTAVRLDLPPAVGAFAAGLALSGNRLSKQIDSIVLPFRETFAAVFFVSIGMLLKPNVFLTEPLLLSAGLIGMIALKTAAAALALRCVGLTWRSSFGMGLGLSQLGEFSFLLIAQGVDGKLIAPDVFNRMLFIALGTLILTPLLLRVGLRFVAQSESESGHPWILSPSGAGERRALIIGIGPIGRQVSSRLEMMGIDLELLDLSPVNLHPFAQLGFRTVAGDARDPAVLRRARAEGCILVVVCVPADEIALQIVRGLREIDRKMRIVVRCRFESHIGELEKAGADSVVSEEAEAAGRLIRLCESVLTR